MSKKRFDRYLIRAQRFGARTVLFQDAAARRLGLTATELECIRLVQHEAPLTATYLADQTGLTRASLSVIVDKLVNRGFLDREQDQSDRRRWNLRANPAMIAEIDTLYEAHAERVEALLSGYSDREFEVALRFMDELAEELKITAVELGQDDAPENMS
ncbi:MULTISPECIES: MarR family transcriptional regulator [unclassified Chromohalobacter]|uniref:MarR family winged helix-turn-helix transcriptional regulator n=1 Tax=unclassified Chromohalobacter TaxID=2628571 RepID=UPI002468878E|nr:MULTISPECIES: MarR family transcriptional regulator [unclassified Chromohalobacter]